jgi:zinc protease
MFRILISLLLSAIVVQAADPPQKAFPWEYDMRDLPNGLRVVTVPTDFPNVVALYIVVRTGSRNEVEPGKTGFAHLFEHMMFRGTKRFPPAKYDQVIKEMGAARNAYTTDDRTVYHTTFSKEDLEKIMEVEADRFQNLSYPEAVFRTESLAVLGEYNKNSQSPTRQLFEVLRDKAFDRHTYKHTTMGFLRDIKNMPNQYQYSLQFFDRWYRPEHTSIIVVGDVTVEEVAGLVDKYWSGWERGSFEAKIPAEPQQQGPRTDHIDWPTPTLPWLAVAFKGAAYSDTETDQVTLDIISFLGFDSSSDLYKKVVLEL